MFGYNLGFDPSTHIVIWGAGGHAKSVADAIECQGMYQIEGFVDDINDNEEDWFYNYRLFNDLDLIRSENIVIAVGDNSSRIKMSEKVKQFNFPNIIHPSVIISKTVKIGRGSVLLAGSILNADCHIGDFCVINTDASVDHDCILGNGVMIAPGCHLAGHVKVGDKSWIGVGSCVKEKINIGSNSYIGAGSVVVKDIPDNVLAFGNPCKIIKNI